MDTFLREFLKRYPELYESKSEVFYKVYFTRGVYPEKDSFFDFKMIDKILSELLVGSIEVLDDTPCLYYADTSTRYSFYLDGVLWHLFFTKYMRTLGVRVISDQAFKFRSKELP